MSNVVTSVINLRRALLAARDRTGDASLGTQVKAGRFQAVRVTYRPSGISKVEPLTGWVTPELVAAHFDAL